MLRSSLKPPLARSPIRLRARRVLQPTVNTTQSPPGSLMKTQKPIRANEDETGLYPSYQTTSCDLRALTKMVHQDSCKETMDYDYGDNYNANRSPLFERGRFYEEYARRRNERLKKKKGEKGGSGIQEKKAVYDLGVRTESVKRRGEGKKYETARKGVFPSSPVTQLKEPTATTSRYLLRSVTRKENNIKVSSSPFANGIGEMKTGAKRGRRI
ncbi:hypothetical protein LIER_00353 [Lithospermum erythrorhizon]|uniref:Uncharacterized protein n=1 Tax=Lithospermum erythrorhizon TaxID=34254 RepID=A0AAV3NLJ4_LITER